MIETLVPIQIPPGMYRNGSKLDANGRWYDGHLMRFVEGKPQPIGGWLRLADQDDTELGPIGNTVSPATQPDIHRTAYANRASNGNVYIIFGSAKSAWMVYKNTTTGDWGRSVVMTSQAIANAGGLGFRTAGTDSITLELIPADTWSFDNFGSSVVGVLTSDGRLVSTTGPGISFNAVTNAPTDNKAVVVTPERFVVLLGAGGDLRKVQWADQETLTTWTPTADNQAGDFTLQTSGQIMCGARSRAQTLIWTDTDLWSMNYIGGELVYSFQQEGDNCGIISRNAKVVVDTQAFWMGRDNFYMYDGFVRPIPCEVRDYVFGNFSRLQASQVWAMTVAQHSEVWWFYCAEDDDDYPTRYVAFNYRDNHWSFGQLERSCGLDAGLLSVPLMVGLDEDEGDSLPYVYEHESGDTRGAEIPYLESGIITLDKDRTMRVQRIVPDLTAIGDADMWVFASMFPMQSETLYGPFHLANPTDCRITGKHLRVKFEENTQTAWRVGTTQLGVIPLGRR